VLILLGNGLSTHVSIDLGAESGRISLVSLEDDMLRVEEVYRFPTGGIRVPIGDRVTLRWDVLRFFQEIMKGLRNLKRDVSSVGVDTWGVDFALLDEKGDLISNPYHYRDERTRGVMNTVIEKLGRWFIYKNTGIQFMPINTLYQLYSLVLDNSPQLRIAHTFLMMPDLFNYWLTGERKSEFTIATTTQFFNPLNEDWCYEILDRLNIPTRIFPEVIQAGTVLGKINKNLETRDMQVIATASHDTASAVVAVPANTEDFAYISSGTWSLVGIEVDRPVISEKALEYNFTNEGGYGYTFRFLKNVVGLWLIQELRKEWYVGERLVTYSEIVEAASRVRSFQYFIDPDYEDFVYISEKPMSMRIAEYCKQTGQRPPSNLPEMARTIFESLAFKYRWVIEKIEEISGRKVEVIHIVGGGSRNQLLNQLTAEITRRRVIAGPSEATTIGNAIVQMIALGEIEDIKRARRIISRSFELKIYEPRLDENLINESYEKWKRIIKIESEDE